MPDISIAIPTLNRPTVINELLNTILNQTVCPKEVIVVDDSRDRNTENLLKDLTPTFSAKNIKLKYVRGRGHGLAEARNIGFENTTSEIHCSIDDDVWLDRNYIKEILKIYEAHPDALGVGGHVVNEIYAKRSNVANKVFAFFFNEENRCRVTPSGVSYPQPLTEIITAEWLSGTNSSYKRCILKQFKWDENLKSYSLCEDMDIYYRIQKRYPKTLYMTPYAKVLHNNSQLSRISSEYRVNMEISYHSYFFFKNVKQSFRNFFGFFYGITLGRLALSLASGKINLFVNTLRAEFNLVRNIKNIQRGVFDSFEEQKQTINKKQNI